MTRRPYFLTGHGTAKANHNLSESATGPIAGGGSVKILGSGFGGALAVSFGSASATFQVDSDTQISAVLPGSSATGPVNVTVKTRGGSATASFTYI